MKAVIFAGGSATRLEKYIGSYNKHCIPLGKTLVIEKGIRDLILAGATEFYLITNSGWESDFHMLLVDKLRLKRSCVTVAHSMAPSQPLPNVLLQAEDFVGKDSFILYLGDNLFVNPPVVPLIKSLITQRRPNTIVLTFKDEPSHFGVARFDSEGDVISSIDEKPADRGYRWVVTGLAKYSPEVFEVARLLKQSGNPKHSLSDMHNILLGQQKLSFVRYHGQWFDVGTCKRYFRSLDEILNVHGLLHFDLKLCPRAELLRDTLLAEKINQFTWEMAHERFK